MKKEIEHLQLKELGQDVLGFWLDCVKEQDPINILTRSPEWYAMMAEARQGASVSVARDEGGEVLGVMPMIPVKAPWGGEMMKVVGGELISKAGREADGGVFMVSRTLDSLTRGTAIYFDHLSGVQLAHLDACSRAGGYSVNVSSRSLPHHRLVLPDTREGLRALSSSRTRQKVRAAERCLVQETGALEILDISSYEELLQYKEPLELMMNRTWQAEELGHGFRVENMRQVAGRGWMRCFILKGGAKVLAFAGCYQGMGTLVYEIVGYDQDYRAHSPGKVLLFGLLDKLYDRNRPDYVDYGEGVGSYKSESSNDMVMINPAFICRRRAPVSLQVRWCCVKQILRSRIAGLKRKIHK